MVLTVQIIYHLIAKIDISNVSRRNADFGSCVFQICLKIKAFKSRHFPLEKPHYVRKITGRIYEWITKPIKHETIKKK